MFDILIDYNSFSLYGFNTLLVEHVVVASVGFSISRLPPLLQTRSTFLHVMNYVHTFRFPNDLAMMSLCMYGDHNFERMRCFVFVTQA